MKPAAMPLWLKWVLTLLTFAVLSAAVVIFVSRANNSEKSYSESPTAAAQANQAGEAVSARDQAPHQTRLSQSRGTHSALERAIAADMRTRVAQHDVTGPVQRVSCTPVAPRRPGRRPFRCQALVGGFSYPFVGVADLRARELVWCKDDRASYDPSVEAPLSPACTS